MRRGSAIRSPRGGGGRSERCRLTARPCEQWRRAGPRPSDSAPRATSAKCESDLSHERHTAGATSSSQLELPRETRTILLSSSFIFSHNTSASTNMKLNLESELKLKYKSALAVEPRDNELMLPSPPLDATRQECRAQTTSQRRLPMASSSSLARSSPLGSSPRGCSREYPLASAACANERAQQRAKWR